MIRLTLDKYLDSHKISRYSLAKSTGIRYHIVNNYYKNAVVRYDSDVLNRFCTALGCDVCELIEYQKD
ncbi:MAG: helix-turn-helix transcriptional regulator [Clostridia bacterium]|nr:helix-turn-helix transcriptional regulator [Clostridia bacterium]